jgi:hypothetical protein
MAGSPPTFWGQIIPAGQTVVLTYHDDCLLEITNAVLGLIPDPPPLNPIRVTAKVQIPTTSAENEETDSITETTITLCVLRPLTTEHQRVSFKFSPLNLIEITNPGQIDVHLSGIQEEIPPLTEEEDTSDIEPEAVLEPDEIQSRFRDLASRQGPRPPAKAKSKSKKRNRSKHPDVA